MVNNFLMVSLNLFDANQYLYWIKDDVVHMVGKTDLASLAEEVWGFCQNNNVGKVLLYGSSMSRDIICVYADEIAELSNDRITIEIKEKI